MLQPPGSTGSRRPAQASTRRKTPDSPDTVIRQLQRLAPNKRCADCSSKLPSCVNLTLGTFVCITCAGIHRELNGRVKGVGHSSFTQEEAEFMKGTDNDKVNAVFMARYNPSSERLKRPMDNNDQVLVRTWIRRKYQERAWYSGEARPSLLPQQAQPPRDTSRQSHHHQQPTMVQIPPKQREPQPQVDIFTSPPPQPAPAVVAYNSGWDAFGTQAPQASSNDGWDAFGGSSAQQNVASQPSPQPNRKSFQANFPNESPQPTVAPFQADFGAAQAPPQKQQVQGKFANFTSQQAPPQQSFASLPQSNDGHTDAVGNFPAQGTPAALPQQQANAGFANFNQNQNQASGTILVPGQEAPQQSAPSGFADFNQRASQAMSQTQLPSPTLQAVSNYKQSPPQQAHPGFGAFTPGSQASWAPNDTPTQQGHESVAAGNNFSNAADAISGMDVSKPSTGMDSAKYKTGQYVFYRGSAQSGVAKIVKVHLDDDLVPYYTIEIDGKEKQTDDGHLSEKNPVVDEVGNMIGTLSAAQLELVKLYILKLQQSPSAGKANSASLDKSGSSSELVSGTAQDRHTSMPQLSGRLPPSIQQAQPVYNTQVHGMIPSTGYSGANHANPEEGRATAEDRQSRSPGVHQGMMQSQESPQPSGLGGIPSPAIVKPTVIDATKNLSALSVGSTPPLYSQHSAAMGGPSSLYQAPQSQMQQSPQTNQMQPPQMHQQPSQTNQMQPPQMHQPLQMNQMQQQPPQMDQDQMQQQPPQMDQDQMQQQPPQMD